MSPKMSPDMLRKIVGAHKYILQKFESIDWENLGELTGQGELISRHDRLIRSLGFGDDDYTDNALDVLKKIIQADEANLELIYDFYSINEWLKTNDMELFLKIDGTEKIKNPGFWKPRYLKLFISHLATDKEKANSLKKSLEKWGISSFVAHDDIEPTKEWMTEIESALDSMDCLVAMISPNFHNSNWTDQEVGYALGRHVDIITLRIEADPYGFMGKFQGIQAKGKTSVAIATEIATALFKKPKHRSILLQSLKLSLSPQKSESKIEIIKEIDSRSLASDNELKELVESIALSEYEKRSISEIIAKVKAFLPMPQSNPDDDLPF